MKNSFLFVFVFFLTLTSKAQIGIGTTSPNSTLDVRGSLSVKYTSFSANTTAASTDNMLVFTGVSAATLTLPDATTCQGRYYWVKNTSSNSSTLTIATTSSQTIDGIASWSLTQTNKAIRLVSNGTNWIVVSESLPGNSAGTPWIFGGNNVSSLQNIGTTSNFSLPFITNNTEKMRLTSGGSLGVGTSTFNATYVEKLLIDAGASGNTNYQNVIVGKGNTNSYAQLNIQNNSTGTGASSDVVATADNGNESVNYIDMGINSSGNTSTGALGGANTAYLYSTGNDFSIGNGTTAKNLTFFTTVAGTYTERMRILGSGNVGIANVAPTEKLDVTGNVRFSGALMPNNTAGTSGYVLVSAGANAPPLWADASGYINNLAWLQDGNTFSSEQNFGTISNHDIPVITNNTEKMRITAAGTVGIGTSTFSGANPEKLIVNAGTTGNTNFQNVIVGKGNTNSYAQLNIQNGNGGSAASSDVVATANNGNETVNFIDMGVNGGSNTSTGVLGGANTAYLYATGNDFVIGNSTENKDVIFYTTVPTAVSTERMRVTGTGVKVSGSLTVAYRSGTGNYTLLTTDYVVINTGAAATWTLPAASTCAGKVYRLLNHGTANITLSVAITRDNATTTTNLPFAAGTNYTEIISDGTAWRVLN